METIEMLLNEMESTVLKAKKAAFSSTDILVNRQAMLDLLTRFRASYPIVLKERSRSKRSAKTSSPKPRSTPTRPWTPPRNMRVNSSPSPR